MSGSLKEIVERARNFSLFRKTPIKISLPIKPETWSKELLTIHVNQLIEEFLVSEEQHIDQFFARYTKRKFKGSRKAVFNFCFKLLISLMVHELKSQMIRLLYRMLSEESNFESYQIFWDAKNAAISPMSQSERYAADLDQFRLTRTQAQIILSYTLCLTSDDCIAIEERIFNRMLSGKKKETKHLYNLTWLIAEILSEFRRMLEADVNFSPVAINKKTILSRKNLSMRRLLNLGLPTPSVEFQDNDDDVPKISLNSHPAEMNQIFKESLEEKIQEKLRIIKELTSIIAETNAYKHQTITLLNHLEEADSFLGKSSSIIKHIDQSIQKISANNVHRIDASLHQLATESTISTVKIKGQLKSSSLHNLLWHSGFEVKHEYKQRCYEAISKVRNKIDSLKKATQKLKLSDGVTHRANLSRLFKYFEQKYRKKTSMSEVDAILYAMTIIPATSVDLIRDIAEDELERICRLIEKAIDEKLKADTAKDQLTESVKQNSRAFIEFLPKFKTITELCSISNTGSNKRVSLIYQQLLLMHDLDRYASGSSITLQPTTQKEDTATFDRPQTGINSVASGEKLSVFKITNGRQDFPTAFTFQSLAFVLNSRRQASIEKDTSEAEKLSTSKRNAQHGFASHVKLTSQFNPNNGSPKPGFPNSLSFKLMTNPSVPKLDYNLNLIKKENNGLARQRTLNPFSLEPEDMSEEVSKEIDQEIYENDEDVAPDDSEVMDINQECNDEEASDVIAEDIEEEIVDFNRASFANTLKNTISENVLGSLYKSIDMRHSSDNDTNKIGKMFSDRRQFEEIVSVSNLKESPRSSKKKWDSKSPGMPFPLADRAKQFEKEICEMIDISKNISGQPEIEEEEYEDKSEMSLSQDSQTLSNAIEKPKSVGMAQSIPKNEEKNSDKQHHPFYKMLISNGPKNPPSPDKDNKDDLKSCENIFMKRTNSLTIITNNHSQQSVSPYPSQKEAGFKQFNSFRRKSGLTRTVVDFAASNQEFSSKNLKTSNQRELESSVPRPRLTFSKERSLLKFSQTEAKQSLLVKRLSLENQDKPVNYVEVESEELQSEEMMDNIEEDIDGGKPFVMRETRDWQYSAYSKAARRKSSTLPTNDSKLFL